MSEKNPQVHPSQRSNMLNKFGLEMHNPVFPVSAALIFLFAALTLAFPEKSNALLNGAKGWTLQKFDWLYAATPIIILIVYLGLAGAYY